MKNIRTIRLIASVIALLSLAPLFFTAKAQTAGVEIAEVKNVGVSAGNNAKSVIQVKWTAQNQSNVSIKSFDLVVEVAYADGGREKVQATANGSERSARFEVPTVHITPGRPAAELKQFTAQITANLSETTTKQGTF